ncbi:enolase C-terminal domain-like protein [Nocardia farcinica]|uniref:enolase C-terminal domain-like protein n=1 Tax=Nocardia farcinica TaxID=37329 RepID=UPI002457B0E0|nr:enolase C-terminal domain-like protein [Nocardia farcinica]
MTATVTIEKIEVLDLSDEVEDGDAGFFVGVYAAGHSGWYGPVHADHVSYIERYLMHRLIGCSPFEHQKAVEVLRGHPSPVVDQRCRSWAIGTLDCAIWDLHGKLLSMPVVDLLTSHRITVVPAYGSWLRFDLASADALSTVEAVSADGWAFTKWGLRSELGDAARLAKLAIQVSQSAVNQVAFDALQTWDLDLAMEFCHSVRRLPIVWIEDPLPYECITSYRRIAECGVPLSVGEYFTIDDKRIDQFDIAQLRALTIDVVGFGGITRVLGLVLLARQLGVMISPHGRSLMPAIHLAAAYSDVFQSVEYQLQWEPRRQRLYAEGCLPVHGELHVPSTSGLGTTPRRPDARNCH